LTEPSNPPERSLEELVTAVQIGQVERTLELVQEALDDGVRASVILHNGLLLAMERLGVKFKNNEVWVPEVLLAARALNQGTRALKPYLTESDAPFKGKVVIGTVRGDLHDIGKNLVKMMLEGSGFEVIDIGVNVPDQTFVDVVREQRPDILCLSALLTTTIDQLRSVIDAISAAGLRDSVKILIGGAPVTQSFADAIGADGYAEEAASAAKLAREITALAKQAQ
jgi:5-methyltetrahydrofolate--homocysteine methyltransferase